MSSRMIAIMCGSLGLCLAACAASPPDPEAVQPPAPGEAAEASAVLRIDVETGHTVTFYEPKPGALVVVETMMPAQKRVLGDREMKDALAAFVRLQPGAGVPQALQDAYDRSRSLPSAPDGDAVRAFGGGQPEVAQVPGAVPGVIQQALTSSSSAANFVNNDGGCDWGPQGSFCRVNWANGFWASLSPTTSGVCTVDHYAGNGVTIQITCGNTVITLPPQSPGTVKQYSLCNSGTAEVRRIDILDASGDSFHAGCRWGV